MTLQNRHILMLMGLLYMTYLLVMPKWGHIGDMEYWKAWSNYMHENGLTRIYESGCDYMPGFLYMLWFNTWIQETAVNVRDNLYVFKFFILLFDFLGAWLAAYYVKDRVSRCFAVLFLLVNPAFVYNTVIWAQVDAVFSAIGFLALLAALGRRLWWSCFLLILALNFKLQALVFIPVIGLILLPHFIATFSWQTVLAVVSAFALGQLLMIFPFLVTGHAAEVWHIVTGSVDHYPKISMAAFNFWFLAIPGSVEHHIQYPDSNRFLGMSLKNWGFMLFFSVLTAVIWPYLRSLKTALLEKRPVGFPLEKIFLMSALTATAFFYFNTQMHERYFHPALVSLAAYSFLTGRYFPIVLGSVAYFLNLEHIMQSMALTHYGTLIFRPWFVSGLFLILILYLFWRLYGSEAGSSWELRIDLGLK